MLKKLLHRLPTRRLAKKLDETALADALAAPLYALDPFSARFDDVEAAQHYEALRLRRADEVVEELTVMTWNIKFGGGRIDFWYDGHGDRVIMKDWEVLANLEGLAAKISQVDPDLLLLQEVDVDSKRVAFIDQMQWLLDHTELNFGAYASQWRADVIPNQGLGRVDMGIGILSRFPIRDAQRLALPKMTTQDRITRYFYLKRALLTARVDVPDFGPVHVVNVHTEAFSRDGTKRRHLERFCAELDRIDGAGGFVVGGGDLNTIPPGTKQMHDFEDVVTEDEDFQGSDYRGQSDWLLPLYERYQPAVALDDYRRDNRRYATHSTTGEVFWNRKLDYLFTNGEFAEGTTLTHQDDSSGAMETMLLSDHAPVTTVLRRKKRPPELTKTAPRKS